MKGGLASLVVSLSTALVFSAGCVGVQIPQNPFQSPPVNRKQLPENLRRYYDYPKGKIDYVETSIKHRRNYNIHRIEFPSSMHTSPQNDTARMDYYELKTSDKTPLVIISPILGGSNSESKMFADYFANRGLACAIVLRPKNKFPEEGKYAQSLEDILRQSIIDTRRAIDILEGFPEIDSDRIGSFGISMGGIKNAALAGIDKRLKANIFVMAGADIPYILQHSNEKGVIREIRKARRTITDEELFSQLKEKIISDPKNLAQYIEGRNVLMYLTIFDQVVPLSSQEKLRRLIRGERAIYLPTGHYTAALCGLPPFEYVQTTSFEFFREKFKLPMDD